MGVVLGTWVMMGARFGGCARSGGASTLEVAIGLPERTLARCQGASSTFSLPRCTTALPPVMVNSASLACGSDLTEALLFGRICATVSSTLTAVCELGL